MVALLRPSSTKARLSPFSGFPDTEKPSVALQNDCSWLGRKVKEVDLLIERHVETVEQRRKLQTAYQKNILVAFSHTDTEDHQGKQIHEDDLAMHL